MKAQSQRLDGENKPTLEWWHGSWWSICVLYYHWCTHWTCDTRKTQLMTVIKLLLMKWRLCLNLSNKGNVPVRGYTTLAWLSFQNTTLPSFYTQPRMTVSHLAAGGPAPLTSDCLCLYRSLQASQASRLHASSFIPFTPTGQHRQHFWELLSSTVTNPVALCGPLEGWHVPEANGCTLPYATLTNTHLWNLHPLTATVLQMHFSKVVLQVDLCLTIQLRRLSLCGGLCVCWLS